MGITSREDKTIGWEMRRLGSDLQNNDPEGRTLLQGQCTFSGLGNMDRVRASTNTYDET